MIFKPLPKEKALRLYNHCLNLSLNKNTNNDDHSTLAMFKDCVIWSNELTYSTSTSHYIRNLGDRPHYAKYKDLYFTPQIK